VSLPSGAVARSPCGIIGVGLVAYGPGQELMRVRDAAIRCKPRRIGVWKPNPLRKITNPFTLLKISRFKKAAGVSEAIRSSAITLVLVINLATAVTLAFANTTSRSGKVNRSAGLTRTPDAIAACKNCSYSSFRNQTSHHIEVSSTGSAPDIGK